MRQCIFIFSIILFGACNNKTYDAAWTTQKSPDKFTASFETTKGNFEIEVTREYSPLAVDRLYQMLQHHFYDQIIFYRVVPDFVVQFGNTDTTFTKQWEKYIVPDEQVLKSNVRGTISFARAGKDTRGNDLFINLKDNLKLDTINYEGVTGFPAFGKVTKGMDVVDKLYSGYGNATMDVYDSLSANRKEYLKMFPELDMVKRARVLSGKKYMFAL